MSCDASHSAMVSQVTSRSRQLVLSADQQPIRCETEGPVHAIESRASTERENGTGTVRGVADDQQRLSVRLGQPEFAVRLKHRNRSRLAKVLGRMVRYLRRNGIWRFVGRFASVSKPRPSTLRAPQKSKPSERYTRSCSMKLRPAVSPNGTKSLPNTLCVPLTFHVA